MEQDSPLVSVVVPSYNHEKYIERCIESIYSQDYKNFEVFVFDNNSSDKSRSILSKLKDRYGFELILQDNIGVANTFNLAIKKYIRGEYFTFCASDDYWSDKKLSMQVAFLEANKSIPMCFGKAIAIDSDDNEVVNYTKAINRNLKGGDIFKDIILCNFHPPVNYMIRSTYFEKEGYYKDNIHTEDFFMNLRISSKYNIGYLDDYISYYRVINSEFKRLNLKIYNAKIECINLYCNSVYYNKALTSFYLQAFEEYSMYKEFKSFSFQNLMKIRGRFFNVVFIKGVIKLLFYWK